MRVLPLLACVLCTFLAATALADDKSPALALHPENPHYFVFRGKPTILITSGEHYGALLNRDFDYVAYLNELNRSRLNLTRVFSGTYREVPGSFKIASNNLAPKPTSFVGPYARTDQPGATDGGTKFNLGQWNPEYFTRAKAVLTEASKRGIVVEFVLFCPFYEENLWTANPWNPRNNVNQSPDIGRNDVYTLKHPKMVDRQLAFVRNIVTELNEFDNLYFEICNEPYFGGVTLDWQATVAKTIGETEKNLAKRHLIAQNIANESAKITKPDPLVSIFNFHYARPPKTVDMNYALNKVIGDDETGFQGTGDFVYRAEAWEFLLAGGGLFNNLDYSFTVDHPNGSAKVVDPTPGGGGRDYRAQISFLKDRIESHDFVKMKPDHTTVVSVPKGAVTRTLSESGQAYLIYLKGKNEGKLIVKLPAGSYVWTSSDPSRRNINGNHGKLQSTGENAEIPLHPVGAEDAFIEINRVTR